MASNIPIENANTDNVKAGKPRIPGELGVWMFVAGDLIVFSLFFVLITLGQSEQAEIFSQSRATLDLEAGVLNTVLLLTGSWFAAIGVDKAREQATGNGSGNGSGYFSLAILCGLGFVANKAVEWSDKISAGLNPATNDFYMYFFVFTGIHLLHVIVGLGVLVLIRAVSRRHPISPSDIRTIESGAIFWHLVDLLWIVLFALLYLL